MYSKCQVFLFTQASCLKGTRNIICTVVAMDILLYQDYWFNFYLSFVIIAATMLLMLLFLIFYSPLACYNVYRFVASSLFSCGPIILYVIYAVM